MKLTFFAFLFFVTVYCHAQQTDTLKYCVQKGKVGVGGYDPVSYFKLIKPAVGNDQITLTHDGVVYKFISNENKKMFATNPKAYLPQFGGWCSMTLAMGRATTPKYDNFIILKNKLYLFERTISVNGRELWLRDPKANEKVASTNYTSYRITGKIK